MTVLLVNEGPEEQTQRAREAIARAFPGEPLGTITKGERVEDDEAAIVLPWHGRPWSVSPVVTALRQRLCGRQVYWTDHSGSLQPCGTAFFLREGCRYLWFRALSGVAVGFAKLLAAGRSSPTSIGSETEAKATEDGTQVYVFAVLPDVSHTFIYREILAVLEQNPNARAVCLELAGKVPVHPEAEALAEKVAFVPQRGITRRYASIFRWMITAPRRVGRMFALYAPRPGGSVADVLGRGPLKEVRHPGNGFALADALRPLRPSHIHVYGSTYPASVVMEAACLLDVPFSISSYVDIDFDYDFKMLEEKFRLARFFRVCTKFCQQRLTELLRLESTERVPVLVYGLNPENWPRVTPKGGGILLTAARLVEKKGLHLVPPALAELKQRGYDLRWWVVGEGPELPRLQALVGEFGLEDDVEFHGPLGNDQVRTRLEHTDLALLPCVVASNGERDGIPAFLTEAMASGVPVLTTRTSGIPELVRHGDTGFLAEPDQVGDLADQLEAALGNPSLLGDVARRGREEVRATHDVADSARALRQLINP